MMISISSIFIIMRSSIAKKQSVSKQRNSLAASCSLPEASKSTLNVQQLLQVFSSHYLLVEECFRSIQARLTLLESKLASCFGNFNQVEWKLSRQAHSIRQARSLNQSLILMNSEIEAKLAGVKADYEDFRKRRYVSVMEQRIAELKEAVHGLEIENYRNKFSKHEKEEMEDNLERLEELAVDRREKGMPEEKIYAKIVEDLVRLLKGEGDAGQWMEQKVRENIRLKTQLIRQNA